jgi:hypothetical protein
MIMTTDEAGKTPNLSQEEQHDVDKNQPPRAAVLHEIIRTQGDQELERSVAALWWSALAAGLTMGLSLMAMGLLNSRLPEGEAFKVIASFGYCAGFLAVILARQQLFTENTLTAVLPVMSKPTLGNAGRLLRLWTVVMIIQSPRGACSYDTPPQWLFSGQATKPAHARPWPAPRWWHWTSGPRVCCAPCSGR